MQPTLTFIHGFMGCVTDWDPLRKDIEASADLKTLAVDVPAAKSWSESVDQLSQQVAPNSVLVGYSMGGRLALAVALAVPDHVTGLVVISANPGLQNPEDRASRWTHDSNLANRMRGWNDPSEKEDFLRVWYQQDVFAATPEPIRRSEAKRKLASSSAAWPDVLLANSVSKQPDYWQQLQETPFPVMFVAGADDTKYKDLVNRLAGLGNSTLKTKLIAKCGHIVHREQPDELKNIILEFVSKSVKPNH